MSDTYPRQDVAFKVAVSASLSVLPMFADFLWLIWDEINYVWPKVRTSWTARLYILARYIGIASQIFNVCFTVRMYAGITTSPGGCRLWFIYQAAVVQFLLIFVEGLHMRRVYALFFQGQLILSILVGLAGFQMASMWISASISLESNQYTATCLLMKGNPGNAFFSAMTLTIHMVILFMMYLRHLRLPPQWTRGHGRIVMRDAAISLGAIAFMMLFLMLSSLDVIKSSMSGNLTYYWLVCILWISIGRLVVNQEKLIPVEGEQGESSTWRSTVQFTSQIEMGEDVRSVDSQCRSTEGQTDASATLQGSPATASPLSSPLTDDSPGWLGDSLPSAERGRQLSLQPSSTDVPTHHSNARMGDDHATEADRTAPAGPVEGSTSKYRRPRARSES